LVDELRFKETQTKQSEETLQRLQYDYKIRMDEWKNFELLEEKNDY